MAELGTVDLAPETKIPCDLLEELLLMAANAAKREKRLEGNHSECALCANSAPEEVVARPPEPLSKKELKLLTGWNFTQERNPHTGRKIKKGARTWRWIEYEMDQLRARHDVKAWSANDFRERSLARQTVIQQRAGHCAYISSTHVEDTKLNALYILSDPHAISCTKCDLVCKIALVQSDYECRGCSGMSSFNEGCRGGDCRSWLYCISCASCGELETKGIDARFTQKDVVALVRRRNERLKKLCAASPL